MRLRRVVGCFFQRKRGYLINIINFLYDKKFFFRNKTLMGLLLLLYYLPRIGKVLGLLGDCHSGLFSIVAVIRSRILTKLKAPPNFRVGSS